MKKNVRSGFVTTLLTEARKPPQERALRFPEYDITPLQIATDDAKHNAVWGIVGKALSVKREAEMQLAREEGEAHEYWEKVRQDQDARESHNYWQRVRYDAFASVAELWMKRRSFNIVNCTASSSWVPT